jgi:hypothetical protein
MERSIVYHFAGGCATGIPDLYQDTHHPNQFSTVTCSTFNNSMPYQ